MNTHFGFGDKYQALSAKLIYEYSKKISNFPTFVTGDFNMVPKSQGYNEMITHFTDSNVATINSSLPTFHGYYMENRKQSHIDYCFVNDSIIPRKYEIIEKTFEGKFPSDHYGLYIELEM